jgi:hypothetical protein
VEWSGVEVVAVLELEDADGERWWRTAERAASVSASARVCMGKLRAWGT